jgi:hypothetical protein
MPPRRNTARSAVEATACTTVEERRFSAASSAKRSNRASAPVDVSSRQPRAYAGAP